MEIIKLVLFIEMCLGIVRLAAKKEERDGRKIIIRGTVVIEIPGEGIYRSRRNLGSICDDSWGTNEAIVACKQFAKRYNYIFFKFYFVII